MMRNGFWWLFWLFVAGLIIAAILGFFNGLPWLIGQIALCLILASLLGIFLGWLFGRLFGGGGWRTKYSELESRFSRQSGDLEGLRSDLDARNSAFANLETRFSGVQADLEASRLGRDDLKLELAARTDRMAELEQGMFVIAEKDAEIERLNLRLADWDKDKLRLTALETELSGLKTDYNQRLGLLQEAEKRASNFEARLASISTKGAEQDSLVADLRARLEKAEADKNHDLQLRIGEIEGLRNSLVERDRRLSLLEGELAGKADLDTDKLAELEADLDVVRNMVNDRDARILDLEAQLASYRASSSKASNLELQVTELKTDLQGRSSRIAELEAELAGLKADLEASRQGRSDLQAELAARTDHIGRLESNLLDTNRLATESVNLEIEALKADLGASRQGRSDLQAELAIRTERIGELENQIAALRSEVATKPAEIESLRADLGASRQGRSDLQAELAIRTERIGELEAKLAALSSQKPQETELRLDLERRNARIAELERELRVQQDLVAKADRSAEFKNLQAGLAERDSRIAGLESRLADNQSAIVPSAFTDTPVEAVSAQAPAAPKPRTKAKKKKQVIGYRVTNSRVFRADVVPQGHDPLGVIEGIGNANQQRLWDAGIRTFKDLSETSEDRLKEIIAKDDAFYDEWIVESRRFVRGVYRLSEATSGGSTRRADDLTRIEGIGPKINEALLAAGIRTFEALEAASATQLRLAIEASGITFAPSLETWSKQAAYLVRGDEVGFKAFTDYLIAGRDEGSQT